MESFTNIVPHFIDAIAPRHGMQWDRYGNSNSGYIWCLTDSANFGNVKWCLSIQASGHAFEAHIFPLGHSHQVFPIGAAWHFTYTGGKLRNMHASDYHEANATHEEAISVLHDLWKQCRTGVIPQPIPIG